MHELEWWEHDAFSDRARLEAAELVAFSVFDPALRSRGRVRRAAAALAENDAFVAEMTDLFRGLPTGRLLVPSLSRVTSRLDAIERRLAEVERRIGPDSAC